MRVPVILFILSVAVLSAAIGVYGPTLTMLSVGAGLAVCASLLLIVIGWVRPAQAPKPATRPRRTTTPRRSPAPTVHRSRPKPSGPRVVVDGSNVLYWDSEQPRIDTVRLVVAALQRRGFDPGVIFDANVGYKIGNHYQDDAELARALGLDDDRVLVVPKGTVADETILTAARELKARVVSNDRYRDWADRFPEVRLKNRLMNGTVSKGKVWLPD